MKRRIAVRAIVIYQGKLLCVKLKPYSALITGEFWCTVGGGVDSGEALLPALRREVVEETGIEPVIGNLLYIQQYVTDETEHLEFFFHVTNANDFQNIDLSATTHGEAEIAELDFVDAAANVVYPKFLSQESFANITTQPTKFFNYL